METFEHDGLTFDIHDAGDGRAGTVVALHGFPQTARMWEGVRPHLEAAGYRVVALDQRGYSPGARPAGIRPYSQRHLAADAAALVAALDVGPVHLLGHDWGGAAAWTVAGRRPELVRTLTVLSTPHPAAYRLGMRREQLLRSWYFLAFQVPRLPELFMAAGNGTPFARSLAGSGLPRPEIEHALEVFRGPGARTAAVNWYRALRFGGPSARRTAAPTLYVWGAKDRFLGPTAARATGRFVDGPYRYEELANGTHWLADQQPDVIAGLVLDHIAA